MSRVVAGMIVAFVLARAHAASSPPAPAMPGHLLEVRSFEFAFQAPDSIAAGLTTVRLVDRGKKSHQVSIVRLDDSSSMTRVLKSAADDKAKLTGVRWMGGVETAQPGDPAETMLVLEPGRYVLMCGYADDQSGHSHMAMGMMRTLVVTGAALGAKLPMEPITVRLSDYSFSVNGTMHSGRQLVRVENVGTQRHHMILARFLGKATLADVIKWDGKSEPAPLGPVNGGAALLGPGQSSVASLDLTPGRYQLDCITNDGPAAKPHYLLGMHHEFTVQ